MAQAEYDAFGFPFDHRVSRFEEALQIIMPLLREATSTSRVVLLRSRLRTAPARPPPDGPPILIGGSGARMLRLTARYADAWNATARTTSPTSKRPTPGLTRPAPTSGAIPLP